MKITKGMIKKTNLGNVRVNMDYYHDYQIMNIKGIFYRDGIENPYRLSLDETKEITIKYNEEYDKLMTVAITKQDEEIIIKL